MIVAWVQMKPKSDPCCAFNQISLFKKKNDMQPSRLPPQDTLRIADSDGV